MKFCGPLLPGALFSLLYQANLGTGITVSKEINITVPQYPEVGRQVVDPSLQSFSIEFSSFVDYSGNGSFTNPLNTNLIGNIRSLANWPIHVRVGGSSQNVAWYDPNQKEAIINSISPGSDQSSNTSIGKAFFEGFKVWPDDTVFTIGTPQSVVGIDTLDDAVAIVKHTYQTIGDRLFAVNVGNEQNKRAWSIEDYIAKYKLYAETIGQSIWGDSNITKFQIGDFDRATCTQSNSCWTTESLFNLGINDNKIVKAASTHHYMGGASSASFGRDDLMSHNWTVDVIESELYLASNSVANGVPYFVGETNSLSGHGKKGVSDVLAAALWSLDYTFYAAQTNISRLYFHQGTGWKYSAWNPIDSFNVTAGVKGPYFSWLFSATALSGGNKMVEQVISNNTFTAYAIYDAGAGDDYSAAKIKSLVIINMENFEVKNGGTRTYVRVHLPESITSGSTRIQRLGGPGSDAEWGLKFAGQGIDVNGKRNGTFDDAVLDNGSVLVGQSEAVLVLL